MRTFPSMPEPRWITREEYAAERAAYPLRAEVAYWRNKRRKTHKLLKAARREIQRLRAQIGRQP
jgi:hypothetical protein